MKPNSISWLAMTLLKHHLTAFALIAFFVLVESQCLHAAPVWQDDPPAKPRDAKLPGEMRAMMLTAKAFRVASKRIEPSLVSIESFGGVGAKQGRINGIRKQGEGNTTGVIISPDGYILTSTFNFLQEPPIVTVMTSDGKRRVAKLLGRDDIRKVILLKIDGVKNLPVPEMVPVDEVAVGQWSVSIGYGYGDQSPAVSMGIISATNRIGGRAIQTDANISPANYGGPLVDIEGRMLGMCVPMNPQSQAVSAGVEWYDSGIGFAVPVTDFEAIIDRLKDGTKISPGFCGVLAAPNPVGDGLKVAKVVPDSAAAKAGIKEKDVVLSFNGKKINDMLSLRQLLIRFEAGEEVKVVYVRDEKEETVTLKLGEPPRPKDAVELPFKIDR